MDISAISGAALLSAFDRLDTTASALAGGTTSSNPEGSVAQDTIPQDRIDISSAAIELSEAKVQAETSIKVLKVAQEIQRQTLDLFA